uniref:Uncharacterized protein n=1 Tax=Setaria viridis TaxID=4556 RepID=A0A4U6T1E4_SETVI|nr:hypothetical protein SEVIR_9G299200v2 [Setaria viridis]
MTSSVIPRTWADLANDAIVAWLLLPPPGAPGPFLPSGAWRPAAWFCRRGLAVRYCPRGSYRTEISCRQGSCCTHLQSSLPDERLIAGISEYVPWSASMLQFIVPSSTCGLS